MKIVKEIFLNLYESFRGNILSNNIWLDDKVLNSSRTFLFFFTEIFSLFQIPVLLSKEQLDKKNNKINIINFIFYYTNQLELVS